MKPISMTRFMYAVLFALVLVLFVTIPADAQDRSLPPVGPSYAEMDAPGVSSYDVSAMPLLANTRRVVQGIRGPQGCIVVEQTDRVRPVAGAPITVFREIAFDPATCQYLEEVGTLANPTR